MANKMLIAILLGHVLTAYAFASSVVYQKAKVGAISAHMVTVNLADKDTHVTVALARGGTGKSEAFKSIVRRTRPSAAITGTFFDTRTLIPTGDIAVYGTVVHKGCIGSALCIDSNNRAVIVPMNEGRKQGWDGYETVLCCGPRLVTNGVATVALKREGFGNSLYAPATRTAVGLTRSKKLVLVAVNQKITLQRFAKIMVKIGISDALCLDGGSSTGFYARGRFAANPVRRLTNLLVVYSKSSDYSNARVALVPESMLPRIAAPESKPAFDPAPQLTASLALPTLDDLLGLSHR